MSFTTNAIKYHSSQKNGCFLKFDAMCVPGDLLVVDLGDGDGAARVLLVNVVIVLLQPNTTILNCPLCGNFCRFLVFNFLPYFMYLCVFFSYSKKLLYDKKILALFKTHGYVYMDIFS